MLHDIFAAKKNRLHQIQNSNHHFLSYPQSFLPFLTEIDLWATFNSLSANAFHLIHSIDTELTRDVT